MTDENDPHVVLEKLHQKWASATEETESAMQAWTANWPDQALKDDYYAKLEESNQACQDILEHKRETGV